MLDKTDHVQRREWEVDANDSRLEKDQIKLKVECIKEDMQ